MIQQPDLFSFHNTIHLESEALEKAKSSAEKQEQTILQIFKKYRCRMTPIQVQEIYLKEHGDILLTSVRRAMSNMSDYRKGREAVLRMTGIKVMEKYGKPNYQWELR